MKSGTVAVIGRANAGKSTLINVLVGEKVSIVSPKPQTTRDRILGIVNGEDYQVVFEDTPGVYKASNVLNDRMQRSVVSASKDVDLILFVIDGHTGVKDEDLSLLKKYAGGQIPVIVAFSKTDIMPKEKLPEYLASFVGIEGLADVIPISSRKGKNIKLLLDEIIDMLPEQDRLFSEDVVSNRSERFMIAEIMREKLLLKYDKEIPHGIAIIVNEFSRRDNGIYDINLDIVCEKENHKAILIGKGGKALKEVSSFAREGMEKFLDAKVFLTTFVKVKEDWRNSAKLLNEYGYGEDEMI